MGLKGGSAKPLQRNDDYLDFPVDFMFAAETLAKASESHKNKGSLASAKAEAKANQDDSKARLGCSFGTSWDI